ncbi:hypothetical protein EDD18DRAFT_1353195 [Armillaria luteobubalina]|uniref:Uncharacterized protein n=1 Tax=Armillaria luteobubalina TaxID=153913 RepID=A0AA39Q6Z3_9AGAR|nr:hypothetical protein EDD18DRAFT_1353195 [Armillaria luteobubalina]
MPHSPVPPPDPLLQPPSTLTHSPPNLRLMGSPPIPSFPPSSNLGLTSSSIPSLEPPSTMPASILAHSFLTSTSAQSPPNPSIVFPPISSFQLELMLEPSESHEKVGGENDEPCGSVHSEFVGAYNNLSIFSLEWNHRELMIAHSTLVQMSKSMQYMQS